MKAFHLSGWWGHCRGGWRQLVKRGQSMAPEKGKRKIQALQLYAITLAGFWGMGALVKVSHWRRFFPETKYCSLPIKVGLNCYPDSPLEQIRPRRLTIDRVFLTPSPDLFSARLASRSSSPGFPQHERELTSQGKARSSKTDSLRPTHVGDDERLFRGIMNTI